MRASKILDVNITLDFGYDDVVNYVQQKRGLIATVNPEFLVTAYRDKTYKDILNSAVICVPDGIGVIIADRYFSEISGKSFGKVMKTLVLLYVGIKSFLDLEMGKRRITGVDLFDYICSYAEKNKQTIGLLGGKIDKDGDYSNIVKEKLQSRYPTLKVVFNSSKYSKVVTDDESCLLQMHKDINNNNCQEIDYLFVAYGSPYQEQFYYRNKHRMPVRLCVGVGGTFDFYIDKVSRAPIFIQLLKLEWLYRFITQPSRIVRLYNAVFNYLYLVLKSSF